MSKKKKKLSMGLPYDDIDLEDVLPEDLWLWCTTCGENYEVVTLEDGTITVKHKDEK